jgi:hypothetical protein
MSAALSQHSVMPGLVPGIHVFAALQQSKTWMAGTSPAMTWSVNEKCVMDMPQLISACSGEGMRPPRAIRRALEWVLTGITGA